MIVFTLVTLSILLIFEIIAMWGVIDAYDKSIDDNKAIAILFVIILATFLSVFFQILMLNK